MAMRYLGDRFDIHTGGIDNVFPHHEDEIAQSAPLVGGVPATLWVHGEHLLMARPEDGEVGRQLPARDGAGRARPRPARLPLPRPDLALRPQARLLRRVGRRGAAAALGLAAARLRALGPAAGDGPWARAASRSAPGPPATDRRASRRVRRATGGGDGSVGRVDRARAPPTLRCRPPGRALHERFVAAIDDDLDLPTALAVRPRDAPRRLPADERRWLVLDADRVLGLDLDRVWEPTAHRPTTAAPTCRAVAALVAGARRRARAARDLAGADALRADARRPRAGTSSTARTARPS